MKSQSNFLIRLSVILPVQYSFTVSIFLNYLQISSYGCSRNLTARLFEIFAVPKINIECK
jgi:hypothetical protein